MTASNYIEAFFKRITDRWFPGEGYYLTEMEDGVEISNKRGGVAMVTQRDYTEEVKVIGGTRNVHLKRWVVSMGRHVPSNNRMEPDDYEEVDVADGERLEQALANWVVAMVQHDLDNGLEALGYDLNALQEESQ